MKTTKTLAQRQQEEQARKERVAADAARMAVQNPEKLAMLRRIPGYDAAAGLDKK